MALELVGGALLSSFLDLAFDRLASPSVFDYFRVKKLDDKLLYKLKVVLLSIQALADDAENKHYTNQNVSEWLDLVKDAVLDAEDLLDEIHTESEISKMEAESEIPTTGSKVWSSYFTFTTSLSSFDKELPSRIQDILYNLELLASQKDILGLEKGTCVGMGNNVSPRLPATSLVDEAAVCGRDADKQVIIDLLLSEDDNGSGGNNLVVISIVGMGGMGKTTLAQLVYNDSMVKDEFQLKAWVCVSEDFDIVRLTRTICEAISLSSNDKEDLNSLQVKLKEKLTGKKFLLVLDDVWEENYLKWDVLQAPFVYGARGSKILVTTRSEKVASTMRCAHLHQLKQLPEEQSWLLFSKYALRDSNSAHFFEKIGRKIIKKCKGLPLALKAIGSLLYTKPTHEEWNGILTSEMWDISGGCDIIPALRLSYQYLSSPLKRCFAYCSLIPKDYEFKKDWLVELWMAENFLHVRQQNKGMKELGDQFFNDLLLRSFFQRSSSKDELFVMHDLVNDLATSISKKFCLRLEKEEDAKNISKLTRHISFYGHFLKGSKMFEAIYKANKLRTFLNFTFLGINSGMLDHLVGKCKGLRVLSPDRVSGPHILPMPDSIGNLKHLRYLNLSHNSFKRLPESTCSLFNLETLKLSSCFNLEELPSDMHKLVNLRQLDVRNTRVRKMPNELGKFKKLEVLLTSFYVGKCGECNINQLGELKLLWGTLSIEEMQNVADPVDALAANLKNKIHLRELMFKWSTNDDGSENERDVLEKLQPPENLEELSIRNYGGTRFPDWFGDNYLPNIVSLTLIDCKYCYYLPPLGILPSLEYLSIEGLEEITTVGPEFYGNNLSSAAPFGSLQFLQINTMNGWEEWDCQNVSGAFPCLQKLSIKNCPQLKNKLPQHLPSLLKLEIWNCQQLVPSLPCAPKIQEIELRDCGNLRLEFPDSNTCLEHLLNQGCSNMEFQISHPLNSLRRLELRWNCDTLEALQLDLLPKLQILKLWCCSNLERLNGSTTSLMELRIWCCPKLVSFPPSMPSLTELTLVSCPQVECPEGGLPSSLEKLYICNCPQMNWDLHNCTSLIRLNTEDENGNRWITKGNCLQILKHGMGNRWVLLALEVKCSGRAGFGGRGCWWLPQASTFTLLRVLGNAWSCQIYSLEWRGSNMHHWGQVTSANNDAEAVKVARSAASLSLAKQLWTHCSYQATCI